MEELEPKYELSDTGFPVHEPVGYFGIMLREPNKIRLVNVGPELVRCIHERLEQLVPIETFGYVIFKDYQISFTGRFNIYDIILDKDYFAHMRASKEDMTLIKVVFCRILGALFCYGYDVVTASDLARDLQTHSTIFFKLRDPHDYMPLHCFSHKFICIAPYSTDNILLINVPKVAVEQIIKTIHLTWSPGIKSKQTLADDERSVSVVISLKLSGSPWSTAVYNSGKSTIQARLIVMEVARILATFQWRFAVNINFAGATDSFFFQWCPNLDLEDVRYCAIILSRYDRLRLLQVPTSLTPTIKECVNKFWYLQLLKQREYHGSTEFKLGGCPWWADGNDAIESRYFISCLIGTLKMNGWEVCGTIDLSRHNNDKSTFLLRQASPQMLAHMCISFNKTNRIRLIVSSSDISEDAELQLTTRMNETIKQHWVALGPRNYGKSIEWKLEGDPWDTEGLYSDQTRGVFLLCLLLEVIQPLGWRLVTSTDVSAKNLDPNERGYSLIGKPEDMHTWFFLYDQALRKESPTQFDTSATTNSQQPNQQQTTGLGNQQAQHKSSSAHDLVGGSISVPNLDQTSSSSPPLFNSNPPQSHASSMGLHYETRPYQQYANPRTNLGGHTSQQGPYPGDMVMVMGGGGLIHQQNHSRSVPSVASIDHHLPSFSQQSHPHKPFQQSEQHMIGNPQHHQFPPPQAGGGGYNLPAGKMFARGFDNGSIPNLHHEQPQQSSAADYNYNGRHPIGGTTQNPCLANGRCQTRQRHHLVRQASAGSLPPEHFGTHSSAYGGRASAASYHQVHPVSHLGQMARMEGGDERFPGDMGYYDEGGYKSDGDGYKSDGYGQMFGNRPSRMDMATNANYIQAGRASRSNGYVSDGEGYMLQSAQTQQQAPNKRLSKSGRFGSQSSFQHYPHDIEGKHSRSGVTDDDEQDFEELHPRSTSRTPDTDDNVIVPAPHGRSGAGRFPTFPSNQNRSGDDGAKIGIGGNSSCEELYAVEVMEQTTMTATVRRSNSNSGGAGSNRGDPGGIVGGQRSQRGSRSNSRQGTMGGSSCSDRSIESQGGAKRSDEGRATAQKTDHARMAQASGSRRRGSQGRSIDGYRSEGSNDSPLHGTNQMNSLDLIEVVDGPPKRVVQGRASSQSQQVHPPMVVGPPPKAVNTCGSKRSTSRDRQCSSSKSLNNIERQESSASFQSGQSTHSTHSAPTGHPGGPGMPHHPGPPGQPSYHHHPHPQEQQRQQQQQRFYNPQPARHLHHPNCQIASSSSPGGGMPAPSSGGCMESCSTQSSSSSASAPPDYATCSGIPPTYDQALEVPPKSQRRKWQGHANMGGPPIHLGPSGHAPQQPQPHAPSGRKQKQAPSAPTKNNELYYMGEFYG